MESFLILMWEACVGRFWEGAEVVGNTGYRLDFGVLPAGKYMRGKDDC